MLNLSLAHEGFEKFFPQHGIQKTFDHYIAIIFLQLGNLEALIQIRLKVYYNNAINVR